MTPEEAIQIIETVRQGVQLNGREHDRLREAVLTLAKLVKETSEKPTK